MSSPTTSPLPATQDFTLEIQFDASSQSKNADSSFSATALGFSKGLPAPPQPQPGPDLPPDLSGVDPNAPATLSIVFYETSGQVDQSSKTISKFWIVVAGSPSPLADPLPTKDNPWTVVFRNLPEGGLWGWTGTAGFPVVGTNTIFGLSVFIQVSSQGVPKAFKADSGPVPVIPIPVGAEAVTDPRSD